MQSVVTTASTKGEVKAPKKEAATHWFPPPEKYTHIYKLELAAHSSMTKYSTLNI